MPNCEKKMKSEKMDLGLNGNKESLIMDSHGSNEPQNDGVGEWAQNDEVGEWAQNDEDREPVLDNPSLCHTEELSPSCHTEEL